MATRQEIESKKLSLLRDLRQGCQSGDMKPGSLVPPIRELAARYNISNNVVHQLVQQLIAENVLYAVAGVGTFVGRRQTEVGEFYLCINSDPSLPVSLAQSFAERMTQHGFSERIAELGGASLTLSPKMAQEAYQRGELPTVAGIYGQLPAPEFKNIPHAAFFGHIEDKEYSDAVSFDDLDGGRQATQHLISLGHRRIAFLGAHCSNSTDEATNPYGWSSGREEGWRQTMEAANLPTHNLAFHPVIEPTFAEEAFRQAGRYMARFVAAREEITAVVAANDYIALGLFDGLQAAGTAPDWWPAVVGFDNLAGNDGQLLTSLHLPSDEIGRVAADLLWERRNGQLTGPAVHRQVRMRLFSRLTSRSGWPTLMSFHALTDTPLQQVTPPLVTQY